MSALGVPNVVLNWFTSMRGCPAATGSAGTGAGGQMGCHVRLQEPFLLFNILHYCVSQVQYLLFVPVW